MLTRYPAVPRLAALGACLLVLALLTWQVVIVGPLVILDVRVRDAVAHGHAAVAWLDTPGRLAADLGAPVVAPPVLAVALAVRELAGARHDPDGVPGRAYRPGGAVPRAIVAVVLLLVTVLVMKQLVGRPGPYDALPADGHGGYFPSGHTATAMVCYGSALLPPPMRAPTARGMAIRRWARVVFVLLVLLTGAGLVWSGYHWLSDVLAGYALSAAILLVTRPARVTSAAGTADPRCSRSPRTAARRRPPADRPR